MTGAIARTILATVLAILSTGMWITPLLAQTPTASVVVTVADPSGAVIPQAAVVVTGAEEPTRTVNRTATTGDDGSATVSSLVPGRYVIEAAFPGFESRQLKNVRLRAGDNKQLILLPLEKLSTSIEVGQDKQEAAASRAQSFGTTLTREQLEALSDDPTELQRQLQDMAGPGAVIRIDSFEGGTLPPKAMIKSIRISRDQFAAEYHSAGGVSIDIVTQPGQGPMRYFFNLRGRSNPLNGRSPFTPTRGPERNVTYGFGTGGTLIKDRASFNLNVFGIDAYETPNLNIALADSTRSEALRLRAPRQVLNLFTALDYAITLDQLLRIGYMNARADNDNQGVGGYEEEDRAFSTRNRTHSLRLQQLGPVGRRAFLRSRAQLSWTDSSRQSALDAITIRVQDSFTRGGAQVTGGQHGRAIDAGVDLDYVRGKHSWRTGAALETGRYRSDDAANYLGTYTFSSLDAFAENRPLSFTRRIGDPRINYATWHGALYVQDDIRLRKNLTLTPGLRYEAQSQIRDSSTLGPRIGVTWAPRTNGSTTLRGSWGLFTDWLNPATYEQTLRVDGIRQQEVNILSPSFPDPGDIGVLPPINRYVLGSALGVPRLNRMSGGVDQSITPQVRLAATYSYTRGTGLARGLNLNAPFDGVRPEPGFANIVEVVSDARSSQHQVAIDASVNPGALMAVSSNAPRISWKRTTLFVNYVTGRLQDNTDGAFSVPATGILNADWGAAAADVRHRFNASFNNQVIRNVLLSLSLNTVSGSPYGIRTGGDENADLIFNDRPAGVGRNTLRMPAQYMLNMQVGYNFAFGTVSRPLPPGIGVFGSGGAATVRSVDQGNARYRLNLFVFAQNLTNRRNYQGYSGVLSSRFFGEATMVNAMRKIDFGLNLSF